MGAAIIITGVIAYAIDPWIPALNLLICLLVVLKFNLKLTGCLKMWTDVAPAWDEAMRMSSIIYIESCVIRGTSHVNSIVLINNN